MSTCPETLVLWLADFYLLATLLLLAACAGLGAVRQPARRLAVSWAALAGLAILAIVVAVPGWPRLTIRPASGPESTAHAGGTPRTSPRELLQGQQGLTAAQSGQAAEEYAYDFVLSEEAMRLLLAKPVKGKRAGAAPAPGPKGQATETYRRAPQAGQDRPPASIAEDGRPAWFAALPVLFLTGAGLSLGWLALGAVQVRRLCRHGSPAPPALQELLARVVGAGGRTPRLLLSARICQPAALGMLRPAILLPAHAASGVPGLHLEAVLAHEWAHVRRGDLWLLALSRWLLVLLFAHPLYWWLRARIREDQEALADAWAASSTGAIDYAATLLHWVRLGRKRRGAEAALAFWGRPSELKRRIMMLLNPRFPVETRCPRRWRWSAWSLAGLGALALSLLTLRPMPAASAETPAVKPPAPATKKQPAPQATQAIDLVITNQRGTPNKPKGAPVSRVAGQVVNPERKAVAGALVAVVALPAPESAGEPQVLGQTKTDARGRFQLQWKKPVPADRVVTLIRAAGYGLGWQPYDPSSGAQVRLQAEQVIRGRLIDLQGQPAAGVKVHVCRLGERVSADRGNFFRIGKANSSAKTVRVITLNQDGKMMASDGNKKGQEPAVLSFVEPPAGLPLWPAAVTTDARGQFQLRGIGRGVGVGLQVRDSRFARQALDLKPRKDKKDKAAEITLVLSPARVVEGVVVDADTGKPVPGAQLHIPYSGQGSLALFVGSIWGAGDLDWKGRRTSSGFGAQTLAFFDGGPGADRLADIDVKADKDGRFRVPLFLAGSYRVEVSGPAGEPYFHVTRNVNWPKAAVRQEVKLAVPRGVWVRGKVSASGKPVASARVDFWSPGLKFPEGVAFPEAPLTGADGKFQVLLPPGKWHLVINSASEDYAQQKIPAARLIGKQPARVNVRNGQAVTVDPADKKAFFYPDGWVALDLKPRSRPKEAEVKLHQFTVTGKLVGPDGKPVGQAVLLFRQPLPFVVPVEQKVDQATRFFSLSMGMSSIAEPVVTPVKVRDGIFKLSVNNMDVKYHLYFLDVRNKLGAVAETTGKEALARAPTVKLAACGSAQARFVNDKGKPLAKYRPIMWMLLPPGPHTPSYNPVLWSYAQADQNMRMTSQSLTDPLVKTQMLASDKVWMATADPLHYGTTHVTDVKGRITLPALIGGATYRLSLPDGSNRDFKALPGKAVDLKEITVRQPALRQTGPYGVGVKIDKPLEIKPRKIEK